MCFIIITVSNTEAHTNLTLGFGDTVRLFGKMLARNIVTNKCDQIIILGVLPKNRAILKHPPRQLSTNNWLTLEENIS